jgi:hypothetical protein
MNCFPFVEPGQPVQTGDGTVYYASRKEVPGYLAMDNRGLKVLFSVRHPLARTESHHRYQYEALKKKHTGDLNELVAIALDRRQGGLMCLYDLALEAAETPRESVNMRRIRVERLVDRYQEGLLVNATSRKIYSLATTCIFHSLYFPAVYHWLRYFPRESLRVVPWRVCFY